MAETKLVPVNASYCEALTSWCTRLLITAKSYEWAENSAVELCGFSESGIERHASENETPDGRPGVYVQLHNYTRAALKGMMLARASQTVLTCPTTRLFNAISEDSEKRYKLGKGFSMFGEGYQKLEKKWDRDMYSVPVMEGLFWLEEKYGLRRGVVGVGLIFTGKEQKDLVQFAAKATEKLKAEPLKIILPHPGKSVRFGEALAATRLSNLGVSVKFDSLKEPNAEVVFNAISPVQAACAISTVKDMAKGAGVKLLGRTYGNCLRGMYDDEGYALRELIYLES